MNIASVMNQLDDEWHDWNITPLNDYHNGRLDGTLATLLMAHIITEEEFDRASDWQKARREQAKAKK